MPAADIPRVTLKIALALLKHQLANLVGDEALDIAAEELLDLGGEKVIAKVESLFGSREGAAKLIEAGRRADECFRAECQDPDLRDALSLSFGDLPSIQQALHGLSESLDETALTQALHQILHRDVPALTAEQLDAGVGLYASCLRRALLPLEDYTFRIIGGAVLRTEKQLNTLTSEQRAAFQRLEALLRATLAAPTGQPAPRLGSVPPLPALIIGRADALRDLKARLGILHDGPVIATLHVLTAVRGWPGVGKTTLAAALAHDPEVATAFPDGVLWVSLGPTPSLLSELAAWGRALGTDDLLRARTVEEASAQLAALLRNQRRLLIVDDVWEPEHAIPFKVGGRGCALLVTTRVNSVAQALAPTPNDIYKLPVLTEEKALELLQALASTVVAQYPQESLELVRELEGLPLALQVAGHLLNVEASYGFGVSELIAELREGTKLLEAQAPADRVDLAKETTPTVAVLLQKSTDRLDPQSRDCFAYLGAFAPKPATFDLEAMKAQWLVDDPKPIARRLVDRGLLEPVGGRFQMHALLVMHASSLLSD